MSPRSRQGRGRRPARPRGTHEAALLTSEEIAAVRHALAACSQLLTRAQHDTGLEQLLRRSG
jgi:hypothetical protein